MTKTQQTAAEAQAARYAKSPYWSEAKEDAKHRTAVRASVSLEADDDWLDDVDGE